MKLTDFQLGLLQFFTILLPGAVVAWLIWKLVAIGGPLQRLVPTDPTAAWIGLGIAALLLGQVLERLGAMTCDAIFDWHRNLGTAPAAKDPAFQTMRVFRDETLRLGEATPPAGRAADAAWAASLLAAAGLAPLPQGPAGPRLGGTREPVNIYQFSCAVLRARAPLAWAEVERMQALSKLFRTLTVGTFVVFGSILCLAEPAIREAAWNTLPAPAFVLAALGAYLCYAVLRADTIRRAHRYAVLALAIPEQGGG